jgi:hypothetical protein
VDGSERWRMLGTGLVFLKLGGRVLYRINEVEAHEQQRTRRCTAGRAVAEARLCSSSSSATCRVIPATA